jgi:hypothetical protein
MSVPANHWPFGPSVQLGVLIANVSKVRTSDTQLEFSCQQELAEHNQCPLNVSFPVPPLLGVLHQTFQNGIIPKPHWYLGIICLGSFEIPCLLPSLANQRRFHTLRNEIRNQRSINSSI